MQFITEQYFKNNLSTILDKISHKSLPIIVSREHKPSFVLMPKSGYDAIEDVFGIMGDDIERLYQMYLKSKKPSNIS
jgi:prevent-host-death family protein